MRLTDLDATLKESHGGEHVLTFQCPVCIATTGHYVRVRLSSQPFHERQPTAADQSGDISNKGVVKVWQMAGQFPDSFSVSPSIHLTLEDKNGNVVGTRCWHGFVTNGEAK